MIGFLNYYPQNYYLGTLKFYLNKFGFQVVMQDYQTDPRTIYAIVGNFALMKCDIPSFLADFVTIYSWTDGSGNEYFRDVANNFGNIYKN